jgi:hypothetical protein
MTPASTAHWRIARARRGLQDAFMNLPMRRVSAFPIWFRLLWIAVLLAAPVQAADAPVAKRTELIYGRKFGTALTLDVIEPLKPNGYGVVYMVSGGYFSGHDGIDGALKNGLRTGCSSRFCRAATRCLRWCMDPSRAS